MCYNYHNTQSGEISFPPLYDKPWSVLFYIVYNAYLSHDTLFTNHTQIITCLSQAYANNDDEILVANNVNYIHKTACVMRNVNSALHIDMRYIVYHS